MLELAESRSIRSRMQFWASIAQNGISCGESSAITTSELVETIISVLEVYNDSRSADALLHSISIVARDGDAGSLFSRTLLERLIALASPSNRQPLTEAGMVLALRAMCTTLQSSFDAALRSAHGLSDIVTDAMLAQGTLLLSVRRSGRRRAHSRCASTAIKLYLNKVPHARSLYSSALLALESPTPEAIAIAGALLHGVCDPDMNGNRQGWLKFYTSSIFVRGTQLDDATIESFTPLLKSVTDNEWVDLILPATLRGLKRTPEATCRALPILVDGLPPVMQLDCACSSLMEVLQPLLFGTSSERAEMTLSALSTICQKCSSTANVEMATKIIAVKTSVLSTSQARAMLAAALCKMAPTVLRVGKATCDTSKIIDMMVTLAQKETLDTARQALLKAAGRWMPLTTDTAACISALSKGLSDKNAEVRRAFLGGVLEGLQSASNGSDKPAAMGEVVRGVATALIALVKPALKKPPVGPNRSDIIAVRARSRAFCFLS